MKNVHFETQLNEILLFNQNEKVNDLKNSNKNISNDINITMPTISIYGNTKTYKSNYKKIYLDISDTINYFLFFIFIFVNYI